MGGTENNYLFTGEQFDSAVESYYLRARYYNQYEGRFIQRDFYEGNITNPVSLHKYLYTGANPINFIDPSGLITIQEVISGIKLATVLAITFTIAGSSRIPCVEPTLDEIEHRNQAVTPQQFVQYTRGKTIDQLVIEAGSGTDLSMDFGRGPNAPYGYVKDPSDRDRAIDMKHFLNFGSMPAGTLLGRLYEANQMIQGWHRSVFLLEDLRSNYFGTVFYDRYINSYPRLEQAFAFFFTDLSNGIIRYENC